MLKPPGKSYPARVSRRSFLRIGGLALGGLSLPQVLRAQAQSGVTGSHKAVIMVFLAGGPPHQDMVDLKPDAPVEIRGEFKPIRTNVPGVELCELLPRLAARADRLAVLRSVVGSEGQHAAFQCMTGRPRLQQPQGGWPSFGSSVAKLQGPAREAVPAFVGLSPKMMHAPWEDPGRPGFLGPSYAPFLPNADGLADMTLRGVGVDQLNDRKSLLSGFDGLRRRADRLGELEGADQFTRQALTILTSSRLVEALDLGREDVRLRDRYGRGSPDPDADAGPLLNDYFLAARRLVEAGVRVVTLSYGRWDWHGRPNGTNFENARSHMPMLDLGLSALLDDLYDRGMEKDVSVIVWGEFGRTPKINANAGRDHWPAVSCALLAGGGMRVGQVIGSTDRLAEQAKDRPVSYQEIFATLYHNLGIDVGAATVNDLTGRPRYVVDDAAPIRELV